MESHVEKGISWASSPSVRRSMLGNRSRDTSPEMVVRRYLHGLGFRYRVHARPIKDWNRRADILFPRAKISIFVDGCFWHGCPKHYVSPKSNREYWAAKIARNIERDIETSARLKSDGWLVIHVWEHEDLKRKADEIVDLVQSRLAEFKRQSNDRNPSNRYIRTSPGSSKS